MRVLSLRALIGCALLAGGFPVLHSRANVVDETTIAFRVVQPDGSTVANPVIMVSVLGPDYGFPTVRTGGALGEVVVPAPVEDPYVAQRLAAGETVHLLIRVFDRMPVEGSGANAAYVAAGILVDADGIVRATSSVVHTTVGLHHGADFHPAAPGEVVHQIVEDGGGTKVEECPAPTPGNKPVVCRTFDFPSWSAHTMVPIADNHGAGREMYSEMRYHSTLVTKVGVAVEAGKPGFFAAEGSVDFEKESSDIFTWAPRGPNANVRALLETMYKRSRAGSCFNTPTTGWQCQVETAYTPFQAVGNGSVTAHEINDMYEDFGPHLNAWKGVDGGYESNATSLVRESYSLTLGPDENWAVQDGGAMYANTTITRDTHTRKSFVRSWKITPNPTYSFHYLWVPLGDYDAIRTGVAGGGAYVDTHLGEAWTWAANVDLNEREPLAQPVPDEVPEPDTGEPERRFCGRMPDRCD